MTDTLIISPLRLEHLDELIGLVNSAYRGESSKKGWTTEANLLGGIRTNAPLMLEQLNRPGATMLVARNENGQMAGCVYLQQQVKQCYLGMLTVDPEIQARGIGKQLLAAAEDYAGQLHCSSIVMTVIDKRTELIDWYKRRGYHDTGEKKPFPTDPSFGIPEEPLQFTVLEKNIAAGGDD